MMKNTNDFIDIREGKNVSLIVLTNQNGMMVELTNYGAAIVSIIVPDQEGKQENVVLGYDNINGYYNGNAFYGCVAGRYANRIRNGRFALNGKVYTLAQNNGVNALHGGTKGFDKQVWDIVEISDHNVTFRYVSVDGEEGYPGNLEVTVSYALNSDNGLEINYQATTDADTVLNLTNHSYFNLDGAGNGDVLDHMVEINADAFTPVDDTMIPTGEFRPVEGTPFDFTTPHTIGERIDTHYDQLIKAKGYDHNFILNGTAGELRLAAKVTGPVSGRVLEVWTTEPGMQFYTGNFLDGVNKGAPFGKRAGFCVETQHFPDSPNQPSFPSVILTKGEVYNSTTIFRLLPV